MHSGTMIYSRAYLIYENAEGEQIVVYSDEIDYSNYDGNVNFNDAILNWP